MKKLFASLTLVVTLFWGVVYYNYRTQDQAIFKSLPLPRDFVYETEFPHEEVFLKTLEGTEINGLWFKQPSSKGVVLFLHGRGKNLHFWAKRATPFIEKGYDVFMIDYRGFGKSSNGFKESWLLEDGETAYHFLLEHYRETAITVYGNSMGTSIATWVAANHKPRMLILEAPFYSMLDAAAHTKPFIPEWVIRFILKYHLRTDEWIDKVEAPIYIFHGIPDKTVPFEHSKKLFAKIQHRRENEIIILPNAGHNNIHYDPIYREKLNLILP